MPTMKFICLHGSYGSAKNFEAQLSPFIEAVETNSKTTFQWIDGFHKVEAPEGFAEYFGPPPLYKFIEFESSSNLEDFVTNLRDFPVGVTPEDSIRPFGQRHGVEAKPAVLDAMKRVQALIDADPEIQGILGYSEGAMVATSVVLEEKRKFEEEGIPRRLKCAVFFAGWPPIYFAGDGVKILLADESDEYLDIPSCHIVGCNDPYIHGALALHQVSDPDTAELFDHGMGHTVPRDPKTIQELAASIIKTVHQVGIAV